MDHAPQRDSSKRPAEERDIKGCTPFGQSLDGADAEVDGVDPASRLLPDRFIDAEWIGVDGQNRGGRACILQRQPPISTTDLERPVSVHPAAAEPGHLTRGIQAEDRLAVRTEDPTGEIGLQSTKGLAGEDPQPNRDQGAGSPIEQPVRPRHTDQSIAEVASGGANRQRLLVVGGWIVDRLIPSGDLVLQRDWIEAPIARQRVHPAHQIIKRAGHDEVRSIPLERLNRCGTGPRDHALQQQPDVLVRQVGILFGPGEGKLPPNPVLAM